MSSAHNGAGFTAKESATVDDLFREALVGHPNAASGRRLVDLMRERMDEGASEYGAQAWRLRESHRQWLTEEMADALAYIAFDLVRQPDLHRERLVEAARHLFLATYSTDRATANT